MNILNTKFIKWYFKNYPAFLSQLDIISDELSLEWLCLNVPRPASDDSCFPYWNFNLLFSCAIFVNFVGLIS